MMQSSTQTNRPLSPKRLTLTLLALLLIAVAGTLLLRDAMAPKSDRSFLPFLPDSFYLQESNLFSKEPALLVDFNSVTALDSTHLVAVGDGGTILRSEDSGKTWQSSRSDTGHTLRSVTALDTTHLVAVGNGGTILRSEDSGKTWQSSRSDTGNALFSVTALDTTHLVAVGTGGTILRSEDSGKTWQNHPMKLGINLKDSVMVGDALLMCGSNGIIWLYDRERNRLEPLPYQSRFGYLFYIVLLLMLMAAATVLYYGSKTASENRLDKVETDRPLRSIAEDRYGYAVLVESIVTLLSAPHTQAPLCVALDGEWGSGKSSIVHSARGILSDLGINNLLFNVWHYQNEKNLLAALMRQFLDQLVPPHFSVAGVGFRMKIFFYRVVKKPDTLILLLLIIMAATVLNVRFWDQHNWLVGGADLLLALWLAGKSIRSYSKDIEWFVGNSRRFFGVKDFDHHIGLRDEFKKELEILIRSVSNRCVLFIDDLDRCQDSDILTLMQTINYLSTIDNLYIVMAVDEHKVIDAIARAFKTDGSDGVEQAQHYIEKIFNITLTLPPIGSNAVRLFELSEAEKKSYRWLDRIRRFKDLVMGYAVVVAVAVVLAFYYAPISQSIQRLFPEDTPKPSQTAVVSGGDQNVTDQVTAAVPVDINKTVLAPKKVYHIPAKREPQIWIERGSNAIVFVFLLVGLVALIHLILLAYLRRKKEFKEQKDHDRYIWQSLHQIEGITPRKAKIIYNQVRMLSMIGRRRFVSRRDNMIEWMILSILKWSLYLVLAATDRENAHEVKAVLWGESKTKEQDDATFEGEIGQIIAYLRGEVELQEHDLLAGKLEITRLDQEVKE
jgi:Na+-transporting methylmalonyl-CoA/oxaloacetate decarboxylase gamma subunit